MEPSVFPETPDDEEDVAAPEDDELTTTLAAVGHDNGDDQKDFSWEE